jgi:hypothetical protein
VRVLGLDLAHTSARGLGVPGLDEQQRPGMGTPGQQAGEKGRSEESGEPGHQQDAHA